VGGSASDQYRQRTVLSDAHYVLRLAPSTTEQAAVWCDTWCDSAESTNACVRVWDEETQFDIDDTRDRRREGNNNRIRTSGGWLCSAIEEECPPWWWWHSRSRKSLPRSRST